MITSGNRPTSFGLGEGALCRKQDTWHSLPWTVTCTVHTWVQSNIARTLVRLCVITCTGLQNSSLHSGTCLRVGFFFFSSLLGCYGWVNRCFNFLKHYNHPVAFNSSLPLFFLFFFFRKCAFVIINICLEKSQWWHERWHSRGAFVTTVTKHFEGCALITAQQFRTIFISVLICLKRSFWNK